MQIDRALFCQSAQKQMTKIQHIAEKESERKDFQANVTIKGEIFCLIGAFSREAKSSIIKLMNIAGVLAVLHMNNNYITGGTGKWQVYH